MPRTITFSDEEYELLQELLQEKVANRFFTVQQWQTFNSLSEKAGLPPIAEITNEFLSKYANCFRDCEVG